MKKTTRKIPATMATQHPDHAGKPDWHTHELIETSAEFQEAYLSFADLGVTEYNWDWEGKLVDESVIERLFAQYLDFFTRNQIGRDFFLTFRIPNPDWEVEFRLGRAFMGLLSASGLARKVGLHNPPLFEVILPMTENERQMMAIQEAFKELASLEHRLFNLEEEKLKHIELIPLFEEINIIMDSDKIIEEYLRLHYESFGFKPVYLRPYLARSDPALNAGIIPTVIAIKIALSHYADFAKKHDIELFPMIGAGTLPFRGSLNPTRVEDFINEYHGMRTTTVQSAFRYDYPKETVKAAIAKLEAELKLNPARPVSAEAETELRKLIKDFEVIYKQQVESIAGIINKVAANIPKRRERMQHIGLFGYSRGVGEVTLPRAISFTAALYSIGVPPEMIASGRGLAHAVKSGTEEFIEEVYLNLRKDMVVAGKFLNKTNLKKLQKLDPAWDGIAEDITELEKYLSVTLGPETKEELEHQKLTTKILDLVLKAKPAQKEVVKAALIRKSVG